VPNLQCLLGRIGPGARTGCNDRGNALLEYLTTDLIILNKGTKPTFVAAGRQTVSLIDITLASSDIASFVTEWSL